VKLIWRRDMFHDACRHTGSLVAGTIPGMVRNVAVAVLAGALVLGPLALGACQNDTFADASAPDASEAASGGDAGGAGDASDAGLGADVATSDAISSAPRLLQVKTAGTMQKAAISLAATLSPGSLIVVAAYDNSSNDTMAVTDPLVSNWNAIIVSSSGGCTGTQTQIWYAENVTGGSHTITLTKASTQPMGFHLLEYSGIAKTSSLDGHTGTIGTSASNAITAGTLTTTGASDVIIGLFADSNGGGAIVPQAPLTGEALDTGFYSMVEDDLVASAGPHEVTATLPAGVTDSCWSATAAAFKAAP
jgi:hypothetical protein